MTDIIQAAEAKIRELIAALLGEFSHPPHVIENHARELTKVADSLAAPYVAPEEIHVADPAAPAEQTPAPVVDPEPTDLDPNTPADPAPVEA